MKNPLETSHAFLILLKRCVNNFFKRGFVFTPQLCRSNTIYIQEKKELENPETAFGECITYCDVGGL